MTHRRMVAHGLLVTLRTSAKGNPRRRKPEKSAQRQFKHHFVVPETLASLDQPEIADQAAMSAAHPGESYVRTTQHAAEHALRFEPVNS